MLDSIRSAVEAKFQALVADGRSFCEKAEDFVGLGNVAKQLTADEAALTSILSADGSTVEQKVEAVLRWAGKL